MPRLLATSTLALLLAGGLGTAGAAGEEWTVGRIEEHTRSPGRLRAAVERMGEMDGVYGVLLVHRGELVVERYFREGSRTKPHNLKSASKSVLSALAGLAVAEGKLDLDQPIVEVLGDTITADDPRKAKITVRHLLTMTSGLEPTSYEGYSEWIESSDWVAAAFDRPMTAEPGTFFQYSTGNSHLLSAVIAAATGGSTRRYAEERLFGPIGARIRGWETDPRGVHIGGNNLSLTPRDMARFGQLYLQRGRWGERQVLPPAWVAESTRRGSIGLHPTYGTYGYLWWTDLLYEGAFAAVGFGGQYIYVSPPHDAVLVVTSTLESKGEVWTARLFDHLRHGILAGLEPNAAYYAERGEPPHDPALDSLARAIERAGLQVAQLAQADAEVADGPLWARTSSRVNLRSAPDVDAERLAVLEHGAAIEVLELTRPWIRTRAKGIEGWVHADYVRLEEISWRQAAEEVRRDLELLSLAIAPYLPMGTAPASSPLPAPVSGATPRPEATPAPESEAAAERLAELRVELEAARAEIAELTTARARIEELERQGERLAAERDQLASRLQTAERQAGEQASRQSAELEQAAQERQQLRDDRDRLRREIDQRDERLAGVERDRDAARQEVGRLSATLAEQLAGDELQAELESELERIRRELDERTEEADAARDEGRDLTARLEEARAEIDGLTTRVEEAATRNRDLLARLERAETEDAHLRDRLTEAATQNETLGDRLAEATAQVEELGARREETEAENLDLKARLDQTRTESRGLAARLDEATNQNHDLAARLEASDTEESDLGARLSEARQEIRDLTQRIEEAANRNRDLAAGLELAEQGRERLAAELRQNSSAAAQDQRLAERVERLEAELATAEADSRRLADELAELRAAWATQDLELAETTLERDQLAQELRRSRARAEALGRRADAEASPAVRPAQRLPAAIPEFVAAWAAAWAEGDPARTRAFYAQGFDLPEEALRHQSPPTSVRIEGLRTAERATGGQEVRFTLSYRLGRREISVTKTLELERRGRAWEIRAETPRLEALESTR